MLKIKTAWIIYWEVIGDHYDMKDGEVVTVLSSRLGDDKVKTTLELLYKQFSYTLEERIVHRQQESGPYKVVNPLRVHGVAAAGLQYSIGNNPMLTVRKVKNVCIKKGNLIWDEESIVHPIWLCEDQGFPDCSLKGKSPFIRNKSFAIDE